MLVERYQGRAYRLALRVLRDEDAARDAVQEAFVKAYTALERFEGRSSFFTWLYRLVINQCIDMRRREHGDRRVEWREGDVLEEAELPLAPEAAELAPALPVDLAARSELREHMASAIEKLPDATRETLLLREVDGLSYAEIAEAQGIPKGTVMSRLHYARRKLQELLRGAGVAAGGRDVKHADGRERARAYRDGELSFWARRRVERRLRRDPALRRRLEALEASRNAAARVRCGRAVARPLGRHPRCGSWTTTRAREAAAEEGGSWLDAWRRPIGVAALGAVAAGSVALALLLTPEAAAPPSVRPAPVGSVRWIDAHGNPMMVLRDDREATIIWVPERESERRTGSHESSLRLRGVGPPASPRSPRPPARAADPSGAGRGADRGDRAPGVGPARRERSALRALREAPARDRSPTRASPSSRSTSARVPVNEVWTLELPTGPHAPLRPLDVDRESGTLLSLDVEESVQGDFRVRRGQPLIVGGPRLGDGRLVVVVDTE